MTVQTDRSAHLATLRGELRARIATGNRHALVYGKPVRLLTVSRQGVRARFPSGVVEIVHPEDVR